MRWWTDELSRQMSDCTTLRRFIWLLSSGNIGVQHTGPGIRAFWCPDGATRRGTATELKIIKSMKVRTGNSVLRKDDLSIPIDPGITLINIHQRNINHFHNFSHLIMHEMEEKLLISLEPSMLTIISYDYVKQPRNRRMKMGSRINCF